MAAVPEASPPVLVDLRQLRPDDLEALLQEESGEWERRLQWDFRPSADLVRRFLRLHALNGYALVAGRETIGYCYFVFEERKGLIGDLYLARQQRCPELEQRLLGRVLGALTAMPHVHRVESQLMLLGACAPPCAPDWHGRAHLRNFMAARLDPASARPPAPPPGPWIFEPWHEGAHEPAARLIESTYRGHIDGDINDQYHSVQGARRFLTNIVQYPGCGTFFHPASWLASEPATGRLLGLSLASLIAFDVGHITQICVDPELQGQGLGRALLGESMAALALGGCRSVSLTVTAANSGAVRLYERIGFRTRHLFHAMVWDRPGRPSP